MEEGTFAVIDDKYYGPAQGFGSWFYSKEKVPYGTVRCIRGILFYAYSIYEEDLWWLRSRTHWIPVDDNLNIPENWEHFWNRALHGATTIRLCSTLKNLPNPEK